MRPFEKGNLDFKKGNLVNPYSRTSKDNKEWEYGFNIAYFENLKKVKERESKG
tara:strand:+ start:519 stop:677 length:159 start_codon:yes stop_codon:yes gene_type:complete